MGSVDRRGAIGYTTTRGRKSGARRQKAKKLRRRTSAALAAMAEASDGQRLPPDRHDHAEACAPLQEAGSVVVEPHVPALVAEAVAVACAGGSSMAGELPHGSTRRCGLCGGTSDGEPAGDTVPDVVELKAGSQDEGPKEGTSQLSKADGFGAGKGWLGRLLGPLGEHFGVGGAWVHENCAIWSPEVYFSGIGRLKNVKAAVRRGRHLRCTHCNQPGATIGCRVDRCPQNYHLPCARSEGCLFNHRKYLMACYDHSYLFRTRRKKRFWYRRDLSGVVESKSTYFDRPRISKAERRAAAAAARLKDLEAEEKLLDKSGEDEEFVRRERKRLLRDLAEIAPVKLGGSSRDNNSGLFHEGWDSVAGLQDVVQCMKEMVTLPLLYPEAFQRLGISPPRGVLLHGHPGTGKTLVVRALAGACSRGGQQVAYFARKGADILGKYVGDSERQLRLLFQVAEQCQPAIIFFDEIDGLAPSRCGDRDQTQSSVVSTLLALMDGLSSRGSVVVIGATNRPDSLDPALRRPGRFDREIYFPLPSTADRAAILRLHTQTWIPAPSSGILSVVAKATPGFAGADLQALCVETAMTALRRVVPLKKILNAAEKGILAPSLSALPTIQVQASDWATALARSPLPCSRRLASASLTQVPAAPLPRHLVPVLLPALVELLVKLGLDSRISLPPSLSKAFLLVENALKSARSSNDGNMCDKGNGLPSDWLSVVQQCFKQSVSSLAKSLEYALTCTGIVVDTYGVSCGARPVSTVLFPDRPNGNIENHEIEIDTGGDLSSGTVEDCLIKDLSDECDGATKRTWRGGRFRVLLFGDAKHGQRFVAGAIFNGFEGLAQMRTLSLPAMLMEGGGDVEQGLICILGDARRSSPCVVFMPQIEDWVLEIEHETPTGSPDVQEHSKLGKADDAATSWISNGGLATSLEQEKVSTSKVSIFWKVMKQQLQTMPPDTPLMLLATCEAGAGALPPEVLGFFSPQIPKTSRNSSLSETQTCPCVCVGLPSLVDVNGLMQRASQDVARAMATGFGNRVMRLREELDGECFQEKPKQQLTAGNINLLPSVQRIIADRVSQLRTRIHNDLGRDLRNLGQDWARNLDKDIGKTYANDLAKVFGVDVGRGLGIDLEEEIKDLGSSVIGEVIKDLTRRDLGVDLVDCRRADLRSNIGGECSRVDTARQHEIRPSIERDAGIQRVQMTDDVIIAGRVETRLLNGIGPNGSKDQHVKNIESEADLSAPKECGDCQRGHDGLPASDVTDTPEEGIAHQPDILDSLVSWSPEQKVLQSAIYFCGYQLLRDPQLAELRSATAVLRAAPTVDSNDYTDDGVKIFDWETLEFRTSSGRGRDKEDTDPKIVRGLVAVGLKAQRGIYQTGREFEFELRRVIELLYKRVQQKIDSGKNSLRYFHLTTQAASLLDLMASWVFEVRKLEVAANMQNVPIAQSILDFDFPSDEDELGDSKLPPFDDECPSETAALGASEGGSKQPNCLNEQVRPMQDADSNAGIAVVGAAEETVHKSKAAAAVARIAEKVVFSDNTLHTVHSSPTGCLEGGRGYSNPAKKGVHNNAHVNSAESLNFCAPVASYANGVTHTTSVNKTLGADDYVVPKLKMSQRSDARVQEGTPLHPIAPSQGAIPDSPLLRRKIKQQSLHFKPECLDKLQSVVKVFMQDSCNKEGVGDSVEAVHDVVSRCALSALAASQRLLCSSERTKTTHQIILQWAELTCQCGGDKVAGGNITDRRAGVSPNGLTTSYDEPSIANGVPAGNPTKRKRSKLRASKFPIPPAKRLAIMTGESRCARPAPSPLGLVSPLKQTNKREAYICLCPISRVITDPLPELRLDTASREEAHR